MSNESDAVFRSPIFPNFGTRINRLILKYRTKPEKKELFHPCSKPVWARCCGQGTEGSPRELCHNADTDARSFITSATPVVLPTSTVVVFPTSPPTPAVSPRPLPAWHLPPTTPLPLPLTGARLLHPAFNMHAHSAAAANRSPYLPSRMFPVGVPSGMAPPSPSSSAVTPSPSISAPLPLRTSVDEDGVTNTPVFDSSSFRDGVGGGGGGEGMTLALTSQYRTNSSSAESAPAGGLSSLSTSSTNTAAAFAYQAMRGLQQQQQQEGFPYGLSGVPPMPGYGYGNGNEIYNYVTNGFPRKSRVCSYCSKLFTRSTTRRYHESRCPLLRAAGSLMRGTTSTTTTTTPSSSSSPTQANPSNSATPTTPSSTPSATPTTPSANGDGPDAPLTQPPPMVRDEPLSTSPAVSSSSPPSSFPSTVTTTTTAVAPLTAGSRPTLDMTPSGLYGLYGPPLLPALSAPAVRALAGGATTAPSPSLPSVSAGGGTGVDQNWNSVVPGMKREAVMEVDEVREDDLHLAARGEDAGERQRPLLSSPTSAHSRTPPDEDRGSGEGEATLPFKLPPTMRLKGNGADVMLQHYYHMASLQQQAAGMTSLQASGMTSLQAPGMKSLQGPGMTSLQAPGMKSLQAPGMMSLQAPGMTSLQAPGMKSLQAPGMMLLQGPGMTSLQAPAMKSLQAPGMMSLQATGMTQLQALRMTSLQAPGLSAGIEASVSDNPASTTVKTPMPDTEFMDLSDDREDGSMQDQEDSSFRERDSSSFRERYISSFFRDDDSNLPEDEDTENYSFSNPERGPNEAGGKEEEEKKQCDICQQQFNGGRDLVVHVCLHQRFAPLCCRFCGERFASHELWADHQRCHSLPCPLGCVVCGRYFPHKFALRQHVHRRHGQACGKDTRCRYCPRTIDSALDLRDHYRAHRHSLAPSEQLSVRYLPSPPSADMDSPGDEEEEEEASRDMPPPSIDSKASQDSPPELGSEGGAVAGAGTPSTTDTGPKTSPSKMNGGETGSGSREKEWCRICQKEFPRSFMRYHEKEHADQKPYECSLCKKRFGYKNNMKSHMKLHAGIKPYQCTICLAKFTRGSTLRRHARRHGLNNDNSGMWELFKKSGAALGRDRARELQLLGAALSQDAASPARGKNGGPGSPPVAGARALKADPALMASLGSADPGSSYDVQAAGNGGSSSSIYPLPTPSLPAQLFDAYRSLPQAMFQTYLPQHYLGFSAFNPPLLPTPRQAPQSDALDFSMPGKKRQRTPSPPPPSSSASTTPQPSAPVPERALNASPAVRMTSASGQFPVTPSGGQFPVTPSGGQFPVTSSGGQFPVTSAGQFPVTSAGGQLVLTSGLGERRGDKAEEAAPRRRALYPQHQFQPKSRASLYETVERLMEQRSNVQAQAQARAQAQAQIQARAQAQLLALKQEAAKPHPSPLSSSSAATYDIPARDVPSRSSVLQDWRSSDATVNPLALSQDGSGREASSSSSSSSSRASEQEVRIPASPACSRNAAQDVGSQAALCCRRSLTGGEDPEGVGSPGGASAEGLLGETVSSLVRSGRLFHCRHCDCFFMEQAMFRLHVKLHPPDCPFLCLLCQRDCQDRTTFSSHMLTHLR